MFGSSTQPTSLMDNAEFIAFDLETTGLSPDFNRIVEVGAVRFRADGTELDRIEQLVDSRCCIPDDVIKIHGITDEMVRGQPPKRATFSHRAVWYRRQAEELSRK